MDRRRLRPLYSGPLPVLLLFALLLASLGLISDATQNSAQFGRLYVVLVGVNVAGLALLSGLIAVNLFRLVRQLIAGETGSRLTLRLVAVFVLLAVAPVSLVYTFSLQFLHQGIDSWFDVRIEQALGDALELGQVSLDSRMREMLKSAEQMADRLSESTTANAPFLLDELRQNSLASELTLFTFNGLIIASSSSDPTVIVPDRPDELVLLQLRQGHTYVALEPIGDTGFHIRVVVPVDLEPTLGGRLLQALYPVSGRMNELATSVQEAFADYKELAYLRTPLKYSFTLTLSLVLALSLLSAVWAAFFSARKLAAPIRDLAEGTRAVAAGDYDTRLPPAGRDEMGLLVRSFNEMTRRLAQARDDTLQGQRQLEESRAYLEAVLGRLSSGVVTLTGDHLLRTANTAAEQILAMELAEGAGRSLAELAEGHAPLQPFAEALGRNLQADGGDWSEMVTLFGPAGRQVLMCRGAGLPGGGYVVVFDDITALIQAQRNAAWGEVARRLAHEIKNPLTPIQLSAERLRRRYLKSLAAEEGELLDRSTHTIIQQVEAMKEMVNAFADYARAPRLKLESLDLNRLAGEVLDLYRSGRPGLTLEARLAPELPPIDGDAGRLRQILHNLVKNSLEALPEGAEGRVTVATRSVREAAAGAVELAVEDSGPGFPEALMEQLFEPYVTSKPKGTGLGLAIVKKIVEEHGGMIRAENLAEGGARTIIRLPVPARERGAAAAAAAAANSPSTSVASEGPP